MSLLSNFLRATTHLWMHERQLAVRLIVVILNCMFLNGFQEVDELCDEWVPEPLIPSITEEMKYEPPVLER